MAIFSTKKSSHMGRIWEEIFGMWVFWRPDFLPFLRRSCLLSKNKIKINQSLRNIYGHRAIKNNRKKTENKLSQKFPPNYVLVKLGSKSYPWTQFRTQTHGYYFFVKKYMQWFSLICTQRDMATVFLILIEVTIRRYDHFDVPTVILLSQKIN